MRKGILAFSAPLIALTTIMAIPAYQPSSMEETQVESYQVPLQNLDFSPARDAKEYTSPPVSASFAFDALAASWQLPQGSEVSIRPMVNELERSPFVLLRDDIGEDDGTRTLYADPVFTRLATSFQYRIVIPSSASLTDQGRLTITMLRSPTSPPSRGNVASAAGINIKPRSAWGADESLRTMDGWIAARKKYCEKAGCSTELPNLRASEEATVQAAESYPEEAKIIRSDETVNGQKLLWPEEYVQQVKKFVLHHTAENLGDAIRSSEEFTDEEFQAHIRSVYYYHSIIREWGDIGYNYIVDPLGNVYQGRAGGDKVVGGHTSAYNPGSVGIALMGNFEKGKPPKRQMLAVASLLGTLGTKYGIDPDGKTTFRGQVGPAVLSHRDLGQTACPGEQLYALLPDIRRDARQRFTQNKGSDATVAGATSLTGTVGQKIPVELKVKNNTANIWMKNKIQLSVVNPTRRSLLYEAGSWSSIARPGTMVEATVKPGEVATWKFNVVARKAGTVTEQFRFNIPGKGWLKADPLRIDISAEPRVAKKSLAASVTSSLPSKSPVPVTTVKPSPALVSARPAPTVRPVPTTQPETSANSTIRIRLGYENAQNEATLMSNHAALLSTGTHSKRIEANEAVSIVRKTDGAFVATIGKETVTGTYMHFKPFTEGIVTVNSWDRTPSWSKDGKVNYNKFRGAMRAINEDGKLKLVNYLPLEEYLLGIAESSNTEPEGMRKIMSILSRSYALFYTDPVNRKYPKAPYDGSDSPAEFQYYLGYGFEILAPNWAQSVKDTKGMVVKHAGKLVKTPYFSSSDGRTKDPQIVWGWSAPYLKPVDDSVCPDKVLRGHGVGLSACGARAMINAGKNYLDVIKYYYTGVTVERV